MVISSADNKAVKDAKKLSLKKFRDEEKLYLVEGVKMTGDAIACGLPVKAVFLREDFVDTGGILHCVQNDNKVRNDIVYTVSERVMKALADTAAPQGALAVVRIPEEKKDKPRGRCLLLDGVSDPGNLGALIRSAAAFSYDDVFLRGCADPYSPKAARSSMSGLFHVNVRTADDGVFEKLKEWGIPLIAADMGGADAAGFSAPERFCLAVGSEARGISAETKKAASNTVALPMDNVESLNAAVAGSILMYLLR